MAPLIRVLPSPTAPAGSPGPSPAPGAGLVRAPAGQEAPWEGEEEEASAHPSASPHPAHPGPWPKGHMQRELLEWAKGAGGTEAIIPDLQDWLRPRPSQQSRRHVLGPLGPFSRALGR